ENQLDRQYYAELWEALGRVPPRRRGCLRELLLLEVELENAVWALRLARYYGMGLEAISALLVALPGADAKAAALDGAARAGARPEVSDRKADRRADWEGWKFERLLDAGTEPWQLDARAVEAAARHLLYRRCRLALHRFPFTYVPLYCYFKLKEFETAVALGLFEGIYLGAPAEEIAALAPAGGTA
ncbi:MAG: V-type ATPase subunit, partial [Spirochaetaceae bacterium]|nr:V-type ATPase subunit [Spirochaetaceae bacterium]